MSSGPVFAGLGRVLTETTHVDLSSGDTDENARQNQSRFGVDRSALRDNQLRRYVRAVDVALAPYLQDEIPLIVVGVGRRLSAFRRHSHHRRHLVATVSGTCGHGTPGRVTAELADLVWPSVLAEVQLREQEALDEFDRAIGSRRSATGIEPVGALAFEGRGALLVVEKSYEYPARVEAETHRLIHADDVEHPDVVDDMVDEIIEAVLAKRGRVAIVPDGALADRGRIAMALRH